MRTNGLLDVSEWGLCGSMDYELRTGKLTESEVRFRLLFHSAKSFWAANLMSDKKAYKCVH